MRREGYEMSLSSPTVVKQTTEDGKLLEPWEDVQIECNIDHASPILERMATRNAKVNDMQTVGERQVLKFECATANFLGMRTWLREISGGTAVVVSEFKEMREQGPPPPRSRNGALIANTPGLSTPVDLGKAARLGTLFIPEGTPVYAGMIFGE